MAALAAAVSGISTKPSPGATGVTVRNDVDLVHRTIGLEELAQVMIRRTKRKVTDKDIHAKILYIVKHGNDRQVIRTVCRSTRPEQSVGETAKQAWRAQKPVCDPLGIKMILYSKNLFMARGAATFPGGR